VTVNAPSIYYDTLAKYYIASAGFKWNNDHWKNDLPALAAGDQAMGGSDGFGIQTDRSIQNLNGSMRIYPNTAGNAYYKEYTTSNYFDNSGLGETININDRANAGLIQYSAARGDHTWAFKRNGTGCANFSARYVHTWKDSKLTGFSVSATGFGVSVTNSNESFQRTSPVVRFGC
jgi:hypothetical protein